MKTLRRLCLAGAIILLAGCGQSPTEPTVAPAAPSFDGGFTLGGGNYSDPGTTTTSSTSTSCTSDRAMGGFTLGGGNYGGSGCTDPN